MLPPSSLVVKYILFFVNGNGNGNGNGDDDDEDDGDGGGDNILLF